MEGYNPSVSLLPQGSGVIHHMSGGNAPPNYDPNASLLPNVSANIGVYKGGGGSPVDAKITGKIRVIPNNGRVPGSDEFSNQCMLISLVDHVKNRKAPDGFNLTQDGKSITQDEFTLEILRNFVIHTDDDKKIWPPNVEYDYNNGISEKDRNDAYKNPSKYITQNTILKHISNIYQINIYIRFKYGNKLLKPFYLLGGDAMIATPNYTDAEIISYGNHFELYIPDSNTYPNSSTLGNEVDLSGGKKINRNVTKNLNNINQYDIETLFDIQTDINNKISTLRNKIARVTNNTFNANDFTTLDILHINLAKIKNEIRKKLQLETTEKKAELQVKYGFDENSYSSAATYTVNPSPGTTGPIGATGATSATDATGVSGTNGPIGVSGTNGPIGATGATDATGPIGATGTTGPIGPIGATGVTGPIGAPGVTGPIGATGTISKSSLF